MTIINHNEINVLTTVMSNPGGEYIEIARECNLSGKVTIKTLNMLKDKGFLIEEDNQWRFVGHTNAESLPQTLQSHAL